MKKNGFTLIEVLAVIVILSIVVSLATISVMKIRNDSLKELLQTKVNNLEAAAKVYGQENPDELKFNCGVEGYSSDFCTVVTVGELIEGNYFKSTERNKDGNIDLINNVTNESMWNDEIIIYKKNNNYYAKYLKNDDINNDDGNNDYIYKDPSITYMVVAENSKSIKVEITVKKGTSDVTEYYYSKDDGQSYNKTDGVTYTFDSLTENTTYKIKAYVKDSKGKSSNIVSREVKTIARPSVPTIAFTSDYKIQLSGSTSSNGSVTYYYSFDNNSFTKGDKFDITSSGTIYAYAEDIKSERSDVVSKVITVNNAQNGSVSSKYYCSHDNSFQDSTTCTHTYAATLYTAYECWYGTQQGNACISWRGDGYGYNYADCRNSCEREANGGYWDCRERSNGQYSCYAQTGTPSAVEKYGCFQGGYLYSENVCKNTYNATLKYVCSLNNIGYDTQNEATNACSNYCSEGTFYNGKCYKLS